MPVFNRRETTLQGLRSLSRIDANGIDIKIFVVDDASPDGTAKAIRESFRDVVLIEGDGTLHYAGGTNRGIAAALEWKPDYVVTMNDDAVFHHSFLQYLVETATSNPRSIIGSLLLLWNEPHRTFQVAPKWKTLEGGWVIPADITIGIVGDMPFEVEAIVGNCVMFPREAIEECGLLDEKRFPYGWGDTQYVTRMRRAGWRLLIDPRSRVWCEPNTDTKPLHKTDLKETLRTLLIDTRHPANLRRQFLVRWESAPSRSKAVTAYTVHLASMVRKAITLKTRAA